MKKQGFSLVELLVAIAIMAVMLALVLPNYLGARERARDSRKKSELAQLKAALRLYYNDYQHYPPVAKCGTAMGTISGCKVGGTGCCPCKEGYYDFASSTDAECNTVASIYMKKLPESVTFGNNVDFYAVSPDGDQFCMTTTLENTSDADLDTSLEQCRGTCGTTFYDDAQSASPPLLENQTFAVCSN